MQVNTELNGMYKEIFEEAQKRLGIKNKSEVIRHILVEYDRKILKMEA